MNEYKLIFKPTSIISKLPSAQTIFGAVCHIIMNTQGQDKFEEYIQSFCKEPWFIHSSMFPLNMLPMVNYNIFTVDYINKNILKLKEENQLNYLQKMKKYKKISYMSETVYNNYVVGNQFAQLQNDIIENNNVRIKDHCLLQDNDLQMQNMSQQLNTHVHIKDYYMKEKSDEKGLYYDDAIYCSPDALFYILVKTNKSVQELENIFKYSHYFGFGARHSVGKNSFELVKIEEVRHNMNNQNYRMLLSKSLLDTSFVLQDSHYQIESIQYRPSSMYINRLTHRMNLFKEGSYMRVDAHKEWVGELMEFHVDDKPLYYYAIGYLV